MQHSRLRTTDDIDLLLIVPQLQLPGLFEAFRKYGFAVELERNIRELREGITTIQFDGVIVDLMLPVIPAYTHVLDRAESIQLFAHSLRIASVEGLIVTKLISFRLQVQADIRDLVASYGSKLDLPFIRTVMESFMQDNDPRRAQFEAFVKEFADT